MELFLYEFFVQPFASIIEASCVFQEPKLRSTQKLFEGSRVLVLSEWTSYL